MIKKGLKLRPIDYIIILVCFAGACISGARFWMEYNATLSKLNEEPVGTITFKRRVAQRRFIDRNIWDRLKQESPIYNGDMIRTIEQSEAIITFLDEVTYLSLSENTIIQIFFDVERGARIDLTGGNLEVQSESQNFLISSGDSNIVVGGQAAIRSDEGDLILSVFEGWASHGDQIIDAGGILALDADGAPSTEPIIVMDTFGSAISVVGAAAAGAVPVEFSWRQANFAPDTLVIVQVAYDSRFNRIAESRDVIGETSVFIPLESGNYWWRIFPADLINRRNLSRMYPSGTLEVTTTESPSLLSSFDGTELFFIGETLVPLSWTVVRNASAYLLEISASADMSNPVVSRNVNGSSVIQRDLDFGRWYWRVTPIFPPRTRGYALPSEIGEFTLTRSFPEVPAPALTAPPRNGNIFIESPSAGRLIWDFDPNATSWLVEISHSQDMSRPMISQNVMVNFFTLPQELLQDGREWHWRVTALGGEQPAVSEMYSFQVTAQDPPPVPRPVFQAASYIPPIPPIIFGANINNWNDLADDTIAANERIISRVIDILNRYDAYNVRIEGHANPLTNPDDYAARQQEQLMSLQPLSEQRARAVRDILVEQGVDPARLEHVGIGGDAAIASWTDRANWWRNRRVEFVVIR